MTQPGSPVMKAVLELCVHRVLNKQYGINALWPTGPICLYHAMKALGVQPRVKSKWIESPVLGGRGRIVFFRDDVYEDATKRVVYFRRKQRGYRKQQRNHYGRLWRMRQIYR